MIESIIEELKRSAIDGVSFFNKQMKEMPQQREEAFNRLADFLSKMMNDGIHPPVIVSCLIASLVVVLNSLASDEAECEELVRHTAVSMMASIMELRK